VKDGQNILQLAIPLNTLENCERLHSFTEMVGLITVMWNVFFP